MSKVEAVEQVLGELHLTEQEKLELAQWLQREQLKREWNTLLKHIDRRIAKYGRPTDEEIVAICKQVRHERYEREQQAAKSRPRH